MDSPNDMDLWALIKQGDPVAFEALYSRYLEKFYTICYWHLLDQESAKDIVQELFIDLWEKRNQINITETVEGYLKVAVRNRVFNYIRSMNTQRKHYDKLSKNLTKTSLATEEQNSGRELRQLYLKEIEKLPPKMKEIYALNKEGGFSITEIAQKLSLSEQTVKNQLGTALKRIRSGLEHYRLIGLLLWAFCYLI